MPNDKKDKLVPQDKEHVKEHANSAHREDRVEGILRAEDQEQEQPVGMGIFSHLMWDVDFGIDTMPQARKKLGAWFNEQEDKETAIKEGRERVKRLKQIAEALYEEFASLSGSWSRQ